MLFWIEAGLSVLLVLIAIRFPAAGSKVFSSIEQSLSGLAKTPHLSVLAVGVLALGLRLVFLPVLPVPEPRINDEFSHLLLADTLLHGRLANPVHPLWAHFETFHVNMQPAYASMYPPAQGILLAAGRVIANEPFAGVCISVALMCAAICWMLQGWISPPWALAGGAIAAVRFGVFSYWANSYWGGAAAAIGGALVLGALIRIVRGGRTIHAMTLGAGVVLLAGSRPYEGLVLVLPVAAVLARWFFRLAPVEFRRSLRHVVVPLVMVVAAGAAALLVYNWRVTGSALRMPQQVNRETYAIAPYFVWQSPRPEPAYRHEEMRGFYTGNELGFYQRQQAAGGFAALSVVKLIGLWFFYLGPALTLPIVLAMATLPTGVVWGHLSPQVQLLLGIAAIFMAGLAVEVFFLPHYAAPMMSVVLAVVVISLRRLRGWHWQGRSAGLFLSRAIPALCLVMVLLRCGAAPLGIPLTPEWPATWYNLPPLRTERGRIIDVLEQTAGHHLVFVRYRSPSLSEYDWVYNAADIDGSKVVWARDMGAEWNEQLLRYYPGRQAWLVEPDEPAPALAPYQPANREPR